MGMTRAKSLLPVKDGHSFLDVIALQMRALRERHGVAVPLLLMNSFRTRAESLALLAKHGGSRAGDRAGLPAAPRAAPARRAISRRSRGRASPSTSGARRATAISTRRSSDLGHARGAARGGASASPSSRTRQSRRHPRPRAVGLVRGERRALRDGGEGARSGRPQGRAPRAPARGRAPHAARERAVSRGDLGELPGRDAPPLLQHQQPVDRPRRTRREAARRGRRAAPAPDPQREAGGPRSTRPRPA